jgi:hypothetical protein
MKTGLEDSMDSMHAKDYLEDESSSLASEEDERRHVRSHVN